MVLLVEAAGDLGVTKIGNGTLTLSGANTYKGATTVSAGTLEATKTAVLPNYTTQAISAASGAVLAVRANTTGASDGWTNDNIDSLLGAGSLSTVAGSALGIDVVGSDTFTRGTLLGANAQGLVKLGTGTLSLTVAQMYTGDTTVKAGALEATTISGPGNTIVAAGASLTATSIVQNTLTIGAGGSVTIRETTGAGNASPVPEPGTWVLIGVGLLSLLAFRRRRVELEKDT